MRDRLVTEVNAGYERSDFAGTLAVTGANFFTESLILAQNERWRRG